MHAAALRELRQRNDDTVLTDTGLADTGLADTGLADTGLADKGLSPETREVLDTLATVAAIQRRHGVDACRRYVVSFTTSAADIAAVHELAGYACPERLPVLDVVPLFESGADLANAVPILDEMIALEPVARRLAETGRRLEVMLGYSDSAKELGMVSATLRLFDVQLRLARWAADHDIQLVLFHGRGGALGRGGGRLAGPCSRRPLALLTAGSRSPSRAR